MNAIEFAKTHRCDADWVQLMGDRPAIVLVPGQRGTYSGFDAVVKEHDCNGMYNIRLPRGGACVDAEHFVPA